jgi:hypothetical protein
MGRCAYIKAQGQRCGSIAMKGYDTCYGHRPDLAEERRRNAAKGGRSGGRGRGSGELSALKDLLSDLTERVLASEAGLETGRAAVANQLINTRLRAIEAERKLRELEELEERLQRLEAITQPTKGARQWHR